MARLQYVSQALERKSHLDLVREACEAGVTWVQLRLKELPEEEVLAQAVQARRICREFGAKLIINDHPHVALAAEADGVHLGADDMDPVRARDLLGDGFLIGGTANTIEDLERLQAAGVDYAGLGLEGYRRVLIQAKLKGLTLPIVAIGGILFDDIRGLLHTGVHGVAISGLISRSPRKRDLVTDIHRLLADHPAPKPHGTAKDR